MDTGPGANVTQRNEGNAIIEVEGEDVEGEPQGSCRMIPGEGRYKGVGEGEEE